MHRDPESNEEHRAVARFHREETEEHRAERPEEQTQREHTSELTR